MRTELIDMIDQFRSLFATNAYTDDEQRLGEDILQEVEAILDEHS